LQKLVFSALSKQVKILLWETMMRMRRIIDMR
jgi:hypothetical protein